MSGDQHTTPSRTTRKGRSILRALPALLAALAWLLAACSAVGPTTPPTASAPASPPTAPASPTASPVPTQPSFPLTVTDDEGTSVTIPEEPERIVSLSPANTETVFTLGAGDRLVGGTDADDYPAEAKALPDVATFQGVVVERVVDLRPDVVLAAGNDFNPDADIARLRDLDIPVIVLYAETVEEVFADIELIGTVVGEFPGAAAMTERMDEQMDAIADVTDEVADPPRVFYELGDQPEIYGPADDSFIADLIELAGGEPITTGSTTAFSIPLERLVQEDPEVIVLGDANYGATPEGVAARPGGWQQMTAVREGEIRPVDDIIVTRPGPRLAEGLAALALAIHPDLELPQASP